MSVDSTKLSKTEHIKENSQQLRGTIPEELLDDSDSFSGDAVQVLKHHGTYQQDHRDTRKAKNADGTPKGKSYICMVRTRIPGGKVTAEQFLAELDLCETYGNGTLRITSRQGFQLHGVLKKNLKRTIRAINDTMLTTLAACGDVERNVLCCPAPDHSNPVRQQMQEMCDRVAEHLKPKTRAYYDIWLKDENGEATNVAEPQPVEEPIYGTRYLPRKFKTAFALAEDNCIDIYSNDLGFLGIVENDELIGYNVLVGGSMGVTPSAKKTFPAIAKRMTFVTPDQVIALAEAVVKVQRDFGNRSDRKVARMKYLIADWGLEKFRAKVEEYYGRRLPEPHPRDVTDAHDHLGWHEQGDGRWYLGINVPSGRIQDQGEVRMKTALRTILETYRMRTRLTCMQSVLLCDIESDQRNDINRMLAEYNIPQAQDLSPLRRSAVSCPALPTCGLSVAESERVMPRLLQEIEAELAKYGLGGEQISFHTTGCPNGCARPYTPDIGLVGRTLGKYTIYLGGSSRGTRMAFRYKDLITLDEVTSTLSPVFAYYKTARVNGESFGDFCHRRGADDLETFAEQFTA